jgi:hypothetical protein
MGHRPLFISQRDDPFTDFDFDLCTMACGAMAIDYHTQGKVRMRGGELVAKTSLTSKEIDDGTNLGDVAAAWARVAKEQKDPGIVLQIRRNTPWSDVTDALDHGRAVILQGNYNVLADKFTCQAGTMAGNGGHAILLLPERSSAGILVADPLCPKKKKEADNFKFIPEAQLRKFAEVFSSKSNVRHANTRAFPPGVPAPVTRTAGPPPVTTSPPPPKPVAATAGLDPTFDRPVAMCDVMGPTDLFDDPAGVKPLVAGWRGAQQVGLYSRPKAGGPHLLAAIRIDTVKGEGEKLRIAWVSDSAVTNVRLAPS